MKPCFFSIVISIIILSRVDPLYAGNIITPFGPISDLCYYEEKDADNDDKLKRCIDFSQHSENGHRSSDISFSVWTGTPANTSTFTYPQSVIELISTLPVNNPSKIALFMALIILNQQVGDPGFLSTDSTGYINNIQASNIGEFTITFQGSNVIFEIDICRASSEWLIAFTRMEGESWEVFEYSVTIPPHSMSFTEQTFHHLSRSSCLAGLSMWIGGLFSRSQKP